MLVAPYVTMTVIAISILVSLGLCVSAPLFMYGTGLALFGLAHVVQELNFIDHRFGARINRSFALMLGALLAAIIGVRTSIVFNLVPLPMAYNVELTLVFLLAMTASIHISSTQMQARIFSIAVAIMIGGGFFISPAGTIVILAILHNLTPIGFIVELVPFAQKRRFLIACCFCMVVLPLLIAMGLFTPLVQSLVGIDYNLSLFANGPLEKHFSVFLPESFRGESFAKNAFSAIVFAQTMHYFAVIYLMPKLLPLHMPVATMRSYFPWPRAPLKWLVIIIATSALLVMYVKNFFFARSFYAIAAAVHAYIEIPILLWALPSIGKKSPLALPRQDDLIVSPARK